MTTEFYYDVYFDPSELEVDRDGHLKNPDALRIIEFEYDEDTDEITACRRVSEKGNVLEDPWKDLQYSDDIAHVGEVDDPTISTTMGRFEGWLDQNLEWSQSYRGDYYNPPEYVCIGITGHIDTGWE